MEFSTRKSYIDWRSEWKRQYKLLSKHIASQKLYRSRMNREWSWKVVEMVTADPDRTHRQQLDLQHEATVLKMHLDEADMALRRSRTEANQMLESLAAAKVKSAEARLANKENTMT